jgi:hypothetical protein
VVQLRQASRNSWRHSSKEKLETPVQIFYRKMQDREVIANPEALIGGK